MLMVCHHLNPSIPEDLAFAEIRIRPSTMAAEDVLHDLGAISMIGSDSQAMGRIGETIIRTWQTAHVMKQRRGSLPGDGAADNLRARRYVAKYTIAPAVTHGLDAEIGSVEPGKLADLVLWEPAFFGVRPHLVLKGGVIAWANMGDANASIPTPQPQLPRPMFGAYGALPARLGAALRLAGRAGGRPGRALGVRAARWCATGDVSRLSKADLPENDALPRIEVDTETFAVRVDGELSSRSRPPSCPWPSATSCSDATTALLLLLLLDSRSPAGRTAHSGGMEAAVGAGLVEPTWPTLGRVLPGRLRTSGRVAAAFAAAAAGLRFGRTGGCRLAQPRAVAAWPEVARMGELDAEFEARTAVRGDPRGVAPAGQRALRLLRAVLPDADLARRGAMRGTRAAPSAGPRRGVAALAGELAELAARAAALGVHRAGQRGGPAARPRPVRGPGHAGPAGPGDRRCAPRRRPSRGAPTSLPADGAPALDLLADFHSPRRCVCLRPDRLTRPPASRRPRRRHEPCRPPARRGPVPRIGIGGPVGSGKTALVAALCRALSGELTIGVVTNDIYTTEDAEFLRRAGVLPDERIRAVQTGACPHTAIRDDISANLDAVEALEADHPDLDLVLVESGGDNLTATFSYGLVHRQIFVIDVAGGDKVPRKGGPGVTRSDLLVINKTDLAPLVGADLSVMDRDAAAVRGGGPRCFTSLVADPAAAEVAAWVRAVRSAVAPAPP